MALRDIKRQIVAVGKTKQITRAMNMVAASKLKNAQLRMENFRALRDKIHGRAEQPGPACRHKSSRPSGLRDPEEFG